MRRVWVFAMIAVASVTGLGYVHPLANLRVETEASSTIPGDAARGQQLFEKRCTGCHSLEQNREGPRLAGVFGRKAGSVPGYNYSAGMKNSGLIWTDQNLEKWLAGPDLLVPGTKMDFFVPNAAERRDLIAYFQHLHVN